MPIDGPNGYDGHADERQTEYEAQTTVIRDAFADIARCDKQDEEIANRRCGAVGKPGGQRRNRCGGLTVRLSATEYGGNMVVPLTQEDWDIICL